jgi:hypothetical protein
VNTEKFRPLLITSVTLLLVAQLSAAELAGKTGKPLPYQSVGVTGHAVMSKDAAFPGEDACVAVGHCEPGQYNRTSVGFGHPSTEFYEIVLDNPLEVGGIHYSDTGTEYPASGGVNPTVEHWDGSKYVKVSNPRIDGPGPDKQGEHWHLFDVVSSTRFRLSKTGSGNYLYLQRFELIEGKSERTVKAPKRSVSKEANEPAQLPYQSAGVLGYAVASNKALFPEEKPCVAVGQCEPGEHERSSIIFGLPSTEFFELILNKPLEVGGIHYLDLGTLYPASGGVNPTVEYWDGSKYVKVSNPRIDGPGPSEYGERWHLFDVVSSTRFRLSHTGHGHFWYLQRFELIEGKSERTVKAPKVFVSEKVNKPVQLPYQSAGVLGYAVASNKGFGDEETCVAVGQCEPGEHERSSIGFGQPSTEYFEIRLAAELEVAGFYYTDIGSMFGVDDPKPTAEYWDGSKYVVVKNPTIEGPGGNRYGTHQHMFDAVSSDRFRLSKTGHGNYWYLQRFKLLEAGVAHTDTPDKPSPSSSPSTSPSLPSKPTDATPAFALPATGVLPRQSAGVTGHGSFSRRPASPGEGTCVALGQCRPGTNARSSVAFGTPSTEYFKLALDRPLLVSGIRYSDAGSTLANGGVRPRVEYWNGAAFVEVSNPDLKGPGPDKAGEHAHAFDPVSSRYFRLLKTGNGGQWHLQRFELVEAAKASGGD